MSQATARMLLLILALGVCLGAGAVWQPVAAQEETISAAEAAAQNTAESPADGTAAVEAGAAGEEGTAPVEPTGAGNVADANGVLAISADELAAETPAAEPEPMSGLSREELAELGFDLPEFVEGQPGFIPDLDVSDLMAEPLDPTEGFITFLGPSDLPPGDVSSIIGLNQTMPDRDLSENFARIVVPVTGTIAGSTETKQFHIEGGLLLYYSGVSITADRADIDEKNEVAVLRDNVRIDDPKYTLQADELRIYFEDKRFHAVGFVQFKKQRGEEVSEVDPSLSKKDRLREYFAGRQFELYCKELFYDWESKEMTAFESVRLKHPAFNGSMTRLDYNDETKEYELSGNTVLEVTEYDWVFENELVEGDDVQKVEALTDGNTRITCERVVYSEESGVAQFYARPGGTVEFKQPTRGITAAYIEINDDTKDFYAEGDGDRLVVYNQTDGEWLFAGGLIDREGVDEDVSAAMEGALSAEAESLTYNFDRKRLELIGRVMITAGEKIIKAGAVIQDETAKFFLMRENVRINPDELSEVIAAQVYIDTENDVLTLVGLVQGKLYSDDLPSADGEDGADGTVAGEPQVEVAAGVFRQQSSVETSKNSSNVAEGG